MVENGTLADVQTKDAPTDASIVTYIVDGKEHQDLTRGSRVKLFDMYYDKFTNVKRIEYGQGTIKPSLWGYSSETAPKKKAKVVSKIGQKNPAKNLTCRVFCNIKYKRN